MLPPLQPTAMSISIPSRLSTFHSPSAAAHFMLPEPTTTPMRGRVRVVTDPGNAILEPEEILVADHTDPGWILLFSSAAGLLVEHGSLLSHAAIVSREMGLPCIVSLPGVTSWLKTGDWVEFDGGTGLVRKLEPQ